MSPGSAPIRLTFDHGTLRLERATREQLWELGPEIP